MAEPAVAIVTAAYRAERELQETIDSVLAQTFGDWEWVIVDDGSDDRTVAIAQAAGDPRIQVQTIDHTGLPALGRNLAIESTRGRFVALLDADDVWYPRKLELQVAHLDAHPDVGLVHSAADKLVGGERVSAEPLAPSAADLVRENSVVSSSVVVRRELLVAHGAFDPDPELWGSLDYELWLRLLPHARFAYLPEPLLLYRVHERQMSAQRERMDAGALRALEKARERSPAPRPDLARSIGILRCVLRRPGRGRRELLEALRHDPTDALAWSWLARAVVGPGTVHRVGGLLRRQRRPTTSS